MNRPQPYGTSDADMSAPDYDPHQDPGLVHLPRRKRWSPATLIKLGILEPHPSGVGWRSTGLLKTELAWGGERVPLSFNQIWEGIGLTHPADLNANGVVEGADRNILRSQMGPCPGPCTVLDPAGTCWGDLDGSCVVDVVDDGLLMSAWGETDPNELQESVPMWYHRVGVALGVYDWTPQSGADRTIGDWPGGELSMIAPDGTRVHTEVNMEYGFTWFRWFEAMRTVGWDTSDENFISCFGVKTLVYYLMRFHNSPYDVPWADQLYATPQQPDRAVKDALQAFLEQLAQITDDDFVGLMRFDDQGAHTVDLRTEQHYNDIIEKLNLFQPYGDTGTPDAIQKAVSYLTYGSGASHQPDGQDPRTYTNKIIVLLTDGQATEPISPEVAWETMFGGPGGTGVVDQAIEHDITIHTFTLGGQGEWSPSCSPDMDPAAWRDHSQCGLGQALAYLTGGEAVRITGFFEQIGEEVQVQLIDKVAPPSGRPRLVE